MTTSAELNGSLTRRDTVTSRLFLLPLLVAAFLVAACGAGAASSASSATQVIPTPSPTAPPAPVTTSAGAVAAVIAREPRLTGITELDPNLIGQGTFYEVDEASGVGAFLVKVTVGWGDCQAGCINRHEWLYAVQPDDTVVLQSEGGDAVPADAWPSPGGDGRTGIMLTTVRGPICPVVTDPPDPECLPTPVPGAVVVIRDVAGAEVANETTGDDGTLFVELEAGTYTLEAQPVEGTMSPPAAQSVTVPDSTGIPVTLEYDTGIR